MDNHHIPTPNGADPIQGLPAIPEAAGPDKGLSRGYCQRSILLLSALAVACVILVLSPVSLSGALPVILAFPFAQIGRGLRALSLPSSPGGAGNITALVLYAAFCLLPVLALAFIRNKRTEDAFLPVISIALFVAMYHMINPGLARMTTLTPPAAMEQALMGGIVYSLIMVYGVMRVMRRFGSPTRQGLRHCIGIMLHLLNVLFVIAAFGVTLAQMLGAFETFGAANTVPGQQLGTTYVFLALQHIARALPYVFNIWVVFAVQRLLSAINAGPYSQEALTAAKNVSRVCVISLTASVLAVAGLNLFQLLFINRLYIVNSNFEFPVTSLLFVLGAMLLTRYIAESKQLKDENDRFV